MNLTLLSLSNTDYIIGGSIVAGILVLALIMFLSLRNKKKNKKNDVEVSDDYVNDLYEALGTNENIKALSIEHKRLKVTIKDSAKVSQNKLKSLEISAFLVGKELKLLIKNEATKVYELLKKKVGEK